MRSHSMSVADVNRFYGSPPLPRFRPPPPPNARSGNVEISELGGGQNDSGSDNEDEMQRHRKPKKHFIHHHNQVMP